ncbi:hypothetical protein FJQ54_12850 [Sandaracinobacter neustonicus]|uniref:Periplasmic heavy metal sensor n=1 Tax=Sandaracinobacter neustonicus TaxID=1715348 RepID=A0A501XGS6_9SPHN|nr:hypothetical protein [Sandaracinobacter neustonicus]TPE59812.1 hypothetical protein FJQ54_12850 [Sandaracinobacter neustonicus]
MKTLILATAALMAAPALAQTAPPPLAAPPAAAAEGRLKLRPMRIQHAPLFGNVSPEGRAILLESMKADQSDRPALKAARDRINTLVGADKLDVPALKRAMEDERKLVDAQHVKRQSALLAAFQKLSPADRKAFADDARKGRDRVEARVIRWREGNPPPGSPPPPPAE